MFSVVYGLEHVPKEAVILSSLGVLRGPTILKDVSLKEAVCSVQFKNVPLRRQCSLYTAWIPIGPEHKDVLFQEAMCATVYSFVTVVTAGRGFGGLTAAYAFTRPPSMSDEYGIITVIKRSGADGQKFPVKASPLRFGRCALLSTRALLCPFEINSKACFRNAERLTARFAASSWVSRTSRPG